MQKGTPASRDEGPSRDGPYGDPKLRLGSEVLVGLSRDLSTSNGLGELVRRFLGSRSGDLQELSQV